MRTQSHDHKKNNETWIALTLKHLNSWRGEQGWGRESLVSEIEKAHDSIAGPARMGIRFEPKTTDVFERMKVNADRVYRWLDDQTKESNLLTLNFTESILSAMPTDVALNWLNDLLMPKGFVVRSMLNTKHDVFNVKKLQDMITEYGEAQVSVAALLDGCSQQELLDARRQLSDALEITQKMMAAAEASIDEMMRIERD
jgi:hypothetical protein